MFFSQEILQKQSAKCFRGVCRHLLLRGDCSGWLYWRSELKKLDTISYWEFFGFIYRTVACIRGVVFKL